MVSRILNLGKGPRHRVSRLFAENGKRGSKISRMPKEELPERILNKSAKDGKIESIKRVEMLLFVRTDLGMTKGK